MIVVILAGGQGQRLGGVDKGEIDLGGTRMVDVITKRLRTQKADIVISGQHNYGLGVSSIPDSHAGPKGPVAGIYAAYLTFETSGMAGFFTVPVDGPNLPIDLLSRLHSADQSCIAQDDERQHPSFAWWRVEDLKNAWLALDFDRSVSLTKLAQIIGAKQVRWDDKTDFCNINTKNDLATYLSRH